MEDRAFDKYTGEICHEDDFDACNDVLYITDITYPLYDMDNKYVGMMFCDRFRPVDGIQRTFIAEE